MKLTNLFLMITCAVMFMTSCNEKPIESQEQEVRTVFANRYPEATDVKWNSQKGYYVVDFKATGKEKTSWFNHFSEWILTQTELKYQDLPEAIRLSHESGDFKNWDIEDIELIERKNHESIYVIEVERNDTEYDLHYLAEGTLIKAFPDNNKDNDYLPNPLSNKITSFLDQKYPQHRITDTDLDDGRIEIDFIHNGQKREALFQLNGDWIRTKTELNASDIPTNIRAAINNSAYRQYRIDDVDFIETPSGSYYLIELERGDHEVDVRIDENGTLSLAK